MKIRIITIVIFAFVSSFLKSQVVTYSPPTYYVIPPTNGCNGIWAIQTPSINCYQYTVYPYACSEIDHVNGDTLFLSLCSIPCNFETAGDAACPQLICSIDYSAETIGSTGSTGATGVTGYTGTTGATGRTGNTGTNGINTVQDDEIQIYPNSSNGMFIITSEITESGMIEIYTITGEKVLTEKILSLTKVNIDVADKAKGIYLVKITTRGKVWTHRIVLN